MIFRPSGPWAGAAPLIAALAACGNASPAADGVVTRDSAGVRIVESPADAVERELGWVLAAEPSLDLGGGDDPRYQFQFVTGAKQLPGGGLMVADMGARELRFYDATGAHVRTQGRGGEGPGEYRWMTMVQARSPDTLIVYDMGQRRLSYVDPTGEFLRNEPFPATGGLHAPTARLPDGRWLTMGNTAAVGPDSPEGVITNELVVAIRPVGDGITDTIAVLEGPDLFRSVSGLQVAFTTVPFTISPSVGVSSAGELAMISGVAAEVRRHDATGRLTGILRVGIEPPPLSAADFDNAVATEMAKVPEEMVTEVRRRYDRMTPPEREPVFDLVRFDADGFIWARRFTRDPSLPRAWTIFDPEGAALGRLETPAGVEVIEIGSDYLLGNRRDEFDVQHVVRYSLTRS